MRKLILAAVAALMMIPARAGDIVTDSIKSEILGTYVKYNVYLPDRYDEENALYPVVYLLHGLWDDYHSWDVRGRMNLVADELMESGECRRSVIIMPNAGGLDPFKEWSGYFNMPGWNYEDFFFQEFIPAVEKKYRGIGDKEHRAIMGLSMGGGGCTVYCQRHPDMFSSCYAMSAWLDNEDNYVGAPSEKNKLYYTCAAVTEHSALKFLDNADEETVKALRSVKWFFDCGDDDFLLELTMKLHMKMRAAEIPDQMTVRNGDHNWEYWHLALRVALPFASRNFAQ